VLVTLCGWKGNHKPGGLPPGGWLVVTCGLTACTPGSAPGPVLSNEYGNPLVFYLYCHLTYLLTNNKHQLSCGTPLPLCLEGWKLLQNISAASAALQRIFSLPATTTSTASPVIIHTTMPIQTYQFFYHWSRQLLPYCCNTTVTKGILTTPNMTTQQANDWLTCTEHHRWQCEARKRRCRPNVA